MKIGTLNCPNCSSTLKVALDARTTTCQYCQTQIFVDCGESSTELKNIKAAADRIEQISNRTGQEVSDIKRLLNDQNGKTSTVGKFSKASADDQSENAVDSGLTMGDLLFPGVIALFALYVMYLAGFWWGIFTASLLGLGVIQTVMPNMHLPASLWTTTSKVTGWTLMLGIVVPILVKCA